MYESTFPLTCVLIVAFAAVMVPSQSKIHWKYDGFVYKKPAASTATVLIKAFYDLVCPYSRDSWPPLKQAVDYYGPNAVSLIVHPFPLPYHDNAFITSHALHVINDLNSSATLDLLDTFFKHQGRFYGTKTRNVSRAAVLDQVIVFASQAVGNSLQSAIRSGFENTETGTKTRASFRYGCSRGVYGTPFFFVNGFLLSEDDRIDYDRWRIIIDPLVTKQHGKDVHPFVS